MDEAHVTSPGDLESLYRPVWSRGRWMFRAATRIFGASRIKEWSWGEDTAAALSLSILQYNGFPAECLITFCLQSRLRNEQRKLASGFQIKYRSTFPEHVNTDVLGVTFWCFHETFTQRDFWKQLCKHYLIQFNTFRKLHHFSVIQPLKSGKDNT